MIDWFEGKNEILKNIEPGNKILWDIVDLVYETKTFSREYKK